MLKLSLPAGLMAVAFLVCQIPPAPAASLSWTVTTQSGGVTFAADVSDADIARIVAAFRLAKGISDGVSDDTVKRLLIRDALDGLLTNTTAIEAQHAATQARQAVPAIVATPTQ